jgi:hypothetical protein
MLFEPYQASGQAVDPSTLSALRLDRSQALTLQLIQSSSSDLLASGLVLGAGSEVGADSDSGTKRALSTDFKLTLLAPIAYNTNINAQPQDATAAYHGTPEFLLEATTKFPTLPLTLYGALDASTDRFIDQPSADGDSAYGVFKATLGDPNDDQGYKLFVEYNPSTDFAPTFADQTSTTNAFALGVNKAFAFDKFWGRVPEVDGLGGTYDFVVQAVGGREATSSPSASFAKLSLEFDYQINFMWALQLEAGGQETWYDANLGIHRDDFLLTPSAALAYVLPQTIFGDKETQHAFGSPEFDLQLSYGSNFSNVPTKKFHQWNIGPTIHHSWAL